MNNFKKGFFVGVIFLILFFNNPAFAFTIENNSKDNFFEEKIFFEDALVEINPISQNPVNPFNNTTENTSSSSQSNINTNSSQSNINTISPSLNTNSTSQLNVPTQEFKCDVSALTPAESKAIMNLTKENFRGSQISDDKNDKATGVDLNDLKLIGEDNDGKTAVAQDAPSRAATSDRFSFLAGRTIDGPFGLGVVFEDTLRVGRCVDTAQENCRVYGNGLAYRTSGKGVANMLVSTSEKFEDFVKKGVTNLSKEEYEAMQNQVADINDSIVKMVQLEPTDQIQNSFRTTNYIAKNATNCNNSECVISSYSAFDKLFNQWFSTDLVVTNFGPMLLNSASKWLNLNTIGPGGGAKNKVVTWLNDRFRKTTDAFNDVPSVLLGKRRVDDYQQLIKKNGFGDIFTEFTVGDKAFSSGAGGYVDALLGPDSPLNKLNADQKKDFFKALQDIKAYSSLSAAQMKAAEKAFDASAKSADDLVAYARKVASQVKDWDDVTFLDFPAWIKKNPELTGLQGYAVKKVGFAPAEGFVDITSGQTFNFTKGILDPFAKNGHWDDYARATASTNFEFEVGGAIGATGHKGLKLFKPQPSKLEVSGASVNDLQSYLAKLGDSLYTVNVPGSGQMPLNASTINFIKDSPGILGTVDIYSSEYAFVRDLMPEEFANIMTNGRIVGRPKTALTNYNDLSTGLRQNADFVARTALGPLDARMVNENKLIQDYFTLKTNSSAFYKAALGPAVLWQAKRGFGSEKFSAFMLPDSWTTMVISQGLDEVYKNSFTDFYANEGSDQGELLSKVINSAIFLPNLVVKEAIDAVAPSIGEYLRAASGEGGLSGIMRDEVKNIAFYSHNENCSGCTVGIKYSQDILSFDIYAPVNLKSFIVEATDSDTAAKEGSTLIAYTRGSNIKGSTGDIPGQEINLSEARRDGTTCEQVLKETNLGWSQDFAGFVVAGTESLAYAINPGFGLLMSGIQQIMITPKLQDCVDDKEGYYIHFYSPPSAIQAKGKSKESLSNDTVNSAISDLTKKVEDITSQENPISESIGKMKEEFDNFSNQAKNANILQASIELLPPTSGSVRGKEIFYIWFKDTLLPTALKLEGVSVTKDGNMSVTKDYDNGDLLINGKKVIENKKEIVGLITQDNRIPAEVVPKTVSTASMPGTSETVFELNVLGEIRIRNEMIKSCVQEAIKKQSGITYNGDELTQVFGDLKAINTELYGNVFVKDRKIQLEGPVPVYGSLNSRFIINGYWDSRLEKDVNQIVPAGKFIGMAFEHGSIVLNPETNEIVIWLRQHKDAVLSSKDVSGLKAKLTSIKDPESDCEQPAIDLEAQGYPNDELGLRKVENFNTSMKHLGPFTQFTTDGKIFEFYAKRDETGECQNYFRVTDKETGKILTDSKIVGGITQDGEGKLSFKTDDGRSHTLDFSADNGIPKIQYNNGPPETLRTAQGPNGSFWFDPNTGQWYPENGMQIPLNQAFKDQGAYFGVDKEGNVTGTAGNPMTFNIGQPGGSGFNIPLTPQTIPGLVLFIGLFLVISFMLTQEVRVKKKKK